MKKFKCVFLSSTLFYFSFILGMEQVKNKSKKSYASKSEKRGLEIQLIEAARNNDLNKVKNLLQNGVDVNCRDECGFTPLIKASWQDCKEMVELLINNKANVNQLDLCDRSALIHASNNFFPGNKEVVELLIRNSADINHKDYSGETALRYAVNRQCIPIVELLINMGANTNIKDRQGETPKQFAFLYSKRLRSIEEPYLTGFIKVSKFLKNFEKNNLRLFPKLVNAIQDNNKDEINKLLRMPIYMIDLDAGDNALHIAAKNRNKYLFNVILSIRPGLINKRNYAGKLPLDLCPELAIHLVMDYFFKK